MEDTIDIAAQYAGIRADIPLEATHLVMTLPSRRNAGMWRLKDGMFIGEAADKTVVFGPNPNKRESRLFISHEKAKSYLIDVVAAEDAEDGVPIIFEHNQEKASLIVLPGGDPSLVVNGAVPNVRKFN